MNRLIVANTKLRQRVVIFEYERGVLYRNGRIDGLLNPGEYRFWRWEGVEVKIYEMRQTALVVAGQEMLTADRAEVRITLLAHFKVIDPTVIEREVVDIEQRMYQEMQLVLRGLVTARELDVLLNDRDELSHELLTAMKAPMQELGIALQRVGIKDIILPGNVRTIMMQELQAERAGRAELITARHEVAAIRARANGAKIMRDNPQIMRTQELDALKAMAYGSGNVVLMPNLSDILQLQGANE